MSRSASALLAIVWAAVATAGAHAQEPVNPVLSGVVRLGEGTLPSGTVVLHQVNDVMQGEIDSTRVAADGTFSFRLPGLPNPIVGELYFASVRHQGVLYFGAAVQAAVQLDSIYQIQAYDTLVAPAEGVDVRLDLRAVILDPQGDSWLITDAFYLWNPRDRTVVAGPGGRVWSYPLPAAATDVETGESETSPDVVTYEAGEIVFRGALPPGERLIMVRYGVPSPEIAIPNPDSTEYFNVLIREPSPPLEIPGLVRGENVTFDSVSYYRSYGAQKVGAPVVRLTLGEEEGPPPVQWIAVILAAILGAGGILALGKRGSSSPAPANRREELLLEVARLDEEFQSEPSRSQAERSEYEARREALIRRLKQGG